MYSKQMQLANRAQQPVHFLVSFSGLSNIYVLHIVVFFYNVPMYPVVVQFYVFFLCNFNQYFTL